MVKTKVTLEIITDRIEDSVQILQELRLGDCRTLAKSDFTVGSTAHVVSPDAEKETA